MLIMLLDIISLQPQEVVLTYTPFDRKNRKVEGWKKYKG